MEQNNTESRYNSEEISIILDCIKNDKDNIQRAIRKASKQIPHRSEKTLYQFYMKRLKKKMNNKVNNQVMVIKNPVSSVMRHTAPVVSNTPITNTSMQLEVMLKLAESLSREERISLIQFLCN
jgi:hypothetical protein